MESASKTSGGATGTTTAATAATKTTVVVSDRAIMTLALQQESVEPVIVSLVLNEGTEKRGYE